MVSIANDSVWAVYRGLGYSEACGQLVLVGGRCHFHGGVGVTSVSLDLPRLDGPPCVALCPGKDLGTSQDIKGCR